MSTSRRSPVRSDYRGRRRPRDEDGATLVIVTLFLPVLLLVLALALDVGNWFEHKRHLQMQADAAALAAALDLRSPCSDATVTGTAAAYGGRDYNAQVQNRQADVHMLVNSQTYFNQTSPVDTTVDTDPPCTSLMVDVKLTETDLPWYFRLARVPFINAHARVGLFTVDNYINSLPLAVPDVAPKKVAVQFIDESTGEILATTPLAKAGASGGLVNWDNSAAPLPVTVDRTNIGVRVIVSGGNSTTCGDSLVSCYDAGSANGLDYIRGWSGAGSGAQPNPPLARGVTLEPGTCADAYFIASTTTCTIGVRATVDFGSLATSNARLTAVVNGNNYTLNYDNATGTWTTGLAIPIPTASGPLPVTLNWQERAGTVGTTACTTSKPCTGTFGTVQRTFSATDTRSGPVKLVDVSEGGVPDKDSIERCSSVLTSCTHNFVVTVGLSAGLEVARDVNDPVVTLRFSGGGSQSQGLDCDPNISLFEDELALGCAPGYQPNKGTPCPSTPNALWSTPNPPAWQCVASQTGQYVNKIPKGLNERILCPPIEPRTGACSDPSKPTACTHPNNWSMFTTGLPANDTRIVQLFVTQFGAFDGSGSSTVPILRFATFYVTGWGGSGGGFPNPCQGNGDDPATQGTIVGHFIKYIDTFATSTGTEVCDLSDTSPCKPVLVQ